MRERLQNGRPELKRRTHSGPPVPRLFLVAHPRTAEDVFRQPGLVALSMEEAVEEALKSIECPVTCDSGCACSPIFEIYREWLN